MTWEIVVGIETHAQLLTKSKIFSGASTAFGAAPNTQASAVDIALPGVLPVLNRRAVELALRFGLAVGGTINRRSIFARKNYFYPDLPKGYQISQYEAPIVQGGSISIGVGEPEKKIRLTRAHLEEDAAKSLHEDLHGMTGIDLNRAGTPLLEIVSEPELRGAAEAVAYAKTLHALVRWIEVCDGNMQEGSFRCDANVSVRRTGESLGTRCEIKNLNSFRFMEQAIEFEANRQIEILEGGGKIEQETRLYDPDRNETRSMRTKEDAQDYRYFPDPDLLPLVITEKMIDDARGGMPELPSVKRAKFEQLGVPAHTAATLTSSIELAEFFESMSASILKLYGTIPADQTAQVMASAANTTVSSLSSKIQDWGAAIIERPNLPQQMGLIEILVAQGKLSSVAAKEVRDAVLAGEGSADEVIKKRGLEQMSDAGAIEKLVDEVLAANAKQVADYRAGKQKAFNSLVGQVMKATRGKADPAQVNEILRRKLAG
ncbi:MAG TPA: Asp-tRNA(Asn)/Glu-tRNA(Gln) amidotransferase subunit GatB, partial [Burkholderiales bacterium]|nr:Asp-tRNA(Asn)/Glu-tRNA(Gln) amidotransferase subunit GatB [Burkholderiales bacterium]